MATVPDINKKILFNTDVHFWLNGYVNKQSCPIWSDNNLQDIDETSLHPHKITVWCALWVEVIIVEYFFINEADQNVTVNVERYIAMINDLLVPELENVDVNDFWSIFWRKLMESAISRVVDLWKLARGLHDRTIKTAELFFVELSEVACRRRWPQRFLARNHFWNVISNPYIYNKYFNIFLITTCL